MKIMNAVWILTALWGSIFGIVVYYWFGREKKMEDMSMDGMSMNMPVRPKWQSVTLSTLHCGAGCTLADIIGSLFLIMFPMALIGGWGFTYVLALIIGVYFQFVAIKEMNNLPASAIIKRAIKADFLSLSAWQVGMYCWMYLLIFHFKCIEPHTALTGDYWFAMQQAMLAGFILALPMNYLLIRAGVKSVM
ncbi:MAG: DUF4396 domain-containing protein [Rikenellaceae bacterium]